MIEGLAIVWHVSNPNTAELCQQVQTDGVGKALPDSILEADVEGRGGALNEERDVFIPDLMIDSNDRWREKEEMAMILPGENRALLVEVVYPSAATTVGVGNLQLRVAVWRGQAGADIVRSSPGMVRRFVAVREVVGRLGASLAFLGFFFARHMLVESAES